MRFSFKAEAMLALCTVIWGGTFPAVKWALQSASPWTIVALRFAAAAMIFALINYRSLPALESKLWIRGALLGVFFFAGFGLQTMGLQFTSVSRSAFLTEALVIFTPMLSFFLHRKTPGAATWTGVGLVLVGLYLLTSPGGLLHWNAGDWLTLACAFAFSCYIMGVDAWSTPDSRGLLATVQSATVAVLAAPMVLLEGPRLHLETSFLLAMSYLVLPGTIIVVFVQMRYQPESSPARASVIFALEPVFAMLYAVGLSMEDFSWRGALGGAIVFLGVAWSEVGAMLSRWLRALLEQRPAG